MIGRLRNRHADRWAILELSVAVELSCFAAVLLHRIGSSRSDSRIWCGGRFAQVGSSPAGIVEGDAGFALTTAQGWAGATRNPGSATPIPLRISCTAFWRRRG